MERQTRQRQAVLDALADSGLALSPTEILSRSQARVPGLNLSTVYRQIKALQDQAEVVRVDLPGQPARFEASCRHGTPSHEHASSSAAGHDALDAQLAQHADHHHHHFHCTVCERVYTLHGCTPAIATLTPAGFQLERHDLTLHGRCAACASAPP